MKQELLFGTAYYPEYMPYDRVEEDLKMMKKAGMNVIRIAESTWSTLEPEPGIFDFSYIDAVIQEAEKQMCIRDRLMTGSENICRKKNMWFSMMRFA